MHRTYCAVHPPSIVHATPRTCAAASEQRKAASSPSCSGEAKSCEGCFSRSSCTFASSCDRPWAAARSSICF